MNGENYDEYQYSYTANVSQQPPFGIPSAPNTSQPTVFNPFLTYAPASPDPYDSVVVPIPSAVTAPTPPPALVVETPFSPVVVTPTSSPSAPKGIVVCAPTEKAKGSIHINIEKDGRATFHTDFETGEKIRLGVSLKTIVIDVCIFFKIVHSDFFSFLLQRMTTIFRSRCFST